MEAPSLERKLVAILAADAVGYSRLTEEDEVAALATLSEQRAIIDKLITRYRSRIANTAGDSVLAEFGSVFDAVQCAVEMQETLTRFNAGLPEARRLPFRVGINVGDVMAKDGDIFGDGVNIAARLQALAEPGGICVSRGVRDQIRYKLPFGFDDLGEQSVKNIMHPIRVFRLRPEGPPPAEPEPALPSVTGAEPPAPAMPTSAGVDLQAIELAFWDSIKDNGQAADFEAYLERYPDGAFAPLARSRLADAAVGGDPQDRAMELAFWESVRDSDNPEMLEAYLEKYPEGEFKALAELRLTELRSRFQGSPADGALTPERAARARS